MLQNQAIQSEDENSATVGPKNRVSDRSKSPQTLKGNNTAEKQPSTTPKAKKYKSMYSDEGDEEPQNETGTSSNSQTIVPVLPLQQGPVASSQGPAASSQGPAASPNSGDEDSEYGDE